jgi:uncharacterized protein YceK
MYDERRKNMKRSVRYGWLVVSLCAGLLVGGCATYYKVTDPQSGKEYYTKEIHNLSGSAVRVKDAGTGKNVSLQISEVKEISQKEYKAGLAAQVSMPTSTPAPEAVPALVAAPSSSPTGTK